MTHGMVLRMASRQVRDIEQRSGCSLRHTSPEIAC
jgi:hypothetical protein